jgi:hypothetical protein
MGLARSALLITLFAGCAAREMPPVGTPVPDSGAAAERLARRSWTATPRQATFAWSLDEAGERFRGRGVVRFQAPDRLRLDLFGPRGETLLAAALVGDSLRLPPAAQGQIALPSPALLWGVLGVIRPPVGAAPLLVAGAGADTTIRYSATGGETWDFRTGLLGLMRVQRSARGGVAESVDLTWATADHLRNARYRAWSAQRTLDLSFDSITNAQPFAPSIWLPQGTSR